MRNPASATLMLMLCFVSGVSVAQNRTSTLEENSNRRGSDYKDFDQKQPKPELCRQACIDDAKCKAWTYVKPGVQGSSARCWLKDSVPDQTSEDCCVSGVIRPRLRAEMAEAPEPPPEPPTSATVASPRPAVSQKSAGSIKIAPGTKIEVKGSGDQKPLPLKPEEQVAFMFVQAIASLEDDCVRHANHVCPLADLLHDQKTPDGWGIRRLKFDPAQDSNYKYELTNSGDKWQLRATPQHQNLGGFFRDGKSMFGALYYNPAGPATEKDKKLTDTMINGDSFVASR